LSSEVDVSTIAGASQSEVIAAQYLSHCHPEVTAFWQYGGWASPASMIADVVSDIFADDVDYVVECGSGLTTLFAAATMRRLGRGKVVALEHAPEFARRTRRFLALNSLEGYADVVDAPLVECTVLGHASRWYDLAGIELARRPNTLLIVDGPPQHGHFDRLGTIQLFDRLARPLIMYLDDCHTAQMAEVIAAWQAGGLAWSSRFPHDDVRNYLRCVVAA
jgi:hypothetical protein